MRNVSDKIVEKIKTHILYSVTFFRKSCRVWDNVEKHGGAREAADNNIIRRMRFVCRITKATHTHTQNMYYLVVLRGNSASRKRLNITLYIYCVSFLSWPLPSFISRRCSTARVGCGLCDMFLFYLVLYLYLLLCLDCPAFAFCLDLHFKYRCSRRDSNPQPRQAISCRPSP